MSTPNTFNDATLHAAHAAAFSGASAFPAARLAEVQRLTLELLETATVWSEAKTQLQSWLEAQPPQAPALVP